MGLKGVRGVGIVVDAAVLLEPTEPFTMESVGERSGWDEELDAVLR